jgi:hypothetical protein
MRFFGSKCRDHVAGKGRQYAREIDRQCERALGKQTSISWGCAVALMLCGCGSNGGATSSGGAPGSGGATSSGGTVSSSGTTSSGGATTAGGATSLGGAPGSGGATSSGGALSSGGTTSSGGSGEACVPGQPAECAPSPNYDPCRDYTCMGWMRLCSGGEWSSVYCEQPLGDAGPSAQPEAGRANGDAGDAGNEVGGGALDSGNVDAGIAVFCILGDGRRIPAGAAYAGEDGCNCCVCASDGRPVCQAAACIGKNGEAGVSPVSCQSDQDCDDQGAPHFCAFNPGCVSPRGTCMSTWVCPLFAVSDMAPFSYCGCDGVTYGLDATRGYPYLPYSHVGACP